MIQPNSSWNLPATDRQIRAITRLCLALDIREQLEEQQRSRHEARQLIYDLRCQLHSRRVVRAAACVV